MKMFGTKVPPDVHLPDRGLDWQAGSYFRQGRHRDRLEDRHTIVSYGSEAIFFGVYDGHSGEAVSSYLANHLHENFLCKLDEVEKLEAEALHLLVETYAEMHEETRNYFCGSCLATGVLFRTGLLVWANLGDCRIIVVGNDSVRRLTRDHNFQDQDEVGRVRALGGDVDEYRLCLGDRSINISRAFGDKHYVPYLSTVPTVGMCKIVDADLAIVAMSDGITCRLFDPEVGKLINNHHQPPEKVAEKIALKALDEGSQDDMTVIVVRLR